PTRPPASVPRTSAPPPPSLFGLLPAGPGSAPARQATLQPSFVWSYDLLTDAERALLRECSVFAGGFDLEAAMAVCPGARLEVLAALVDRSLLLVQHDPVQGSSRYRMLEPIRQVAARRLGDGNEVEGVGTRNRAHYLQLAETVEPLLLSPDEDRWRARLRAEQDNLRAAMAWSRDQGEAEALARMVSALIWFWATPGRITEFG